MPRGYHGRRRASLPAMSLQQPLLSQLNDLSLATPRKAKAAATTDNIPSHRLTTGESSEITSKSGKPHERRRSSLTGTESMVSRVRTDTPSPRNTKTNHKTRKNGNNKSPDDSPDTSPRIEAAAVRYNRGRRHSVDVLMTSQAKPTAPDAGDSTHRAWAAFCRVSDPNAFDAHDYDKDCPSGSSLFRSVLSDLKEDDSGGDETKPKGTHAQKKKTTSKKKLSALVNGDVSRKTQGRQVRFSRDSDSDECSWWKYIFTFKTV